jgi:hypothetical protein
MGKHIWSPKPISVATDFGALQKRVGLIFDKENGRKYALTMHDFNRFTESDFCAKFVLTIRGGTFLAAMTGAVRLQMRGTANADTTEGLRSNIFFEPDKEEIDGRAYDQSILGRRSRSC